jgi:hypothetical protein
MNWWNDFVDWARTDAGLTALTGVILPFAAIVVAGVIGAILGRGATRRLVLQRERESRASAVAALVSAGRAASTWHSLPPAAKEHSESLAGAADIQVRLLPISGAGLAADWAEHQLADMRANSVNYTFQADQTLDEYRDMLVAWLHKPGKAKKLFADDLDRWQYDTSKPDPIALEQTRWAEQQFATETHTQVEHESDLPLLGPTSMSSKR